MLANNVPATRHACHSHTSYPVTSITAAIVTRRGAPGLKERERILLDTHYSIRLVHHSRMSRVCAGKCLSVRAFGCEGGGDAAIPAPCPPSHPASTWAVLCRARAALRCAALPSFRAAPPAIPAPPAPLASSLPASGSLTSQAAGCLPPRTAGSCPRRGAGGRHPEAGDGTPSTRAQNGQPRGPAGDANSQRLLLAGGDPEPPGRLQRAAPAERRPQVRATQ